MPEVKKQSALSKATAAYERMKVQADKAKATGTMLAREIVSTGESLAVSVGVGFADEYWGVEKNGVRTHTVSGVPTALLGAAALKLAGALGVTGEFQRDAFAFGTGAACGYGTNQGRALAIKFRASQAAKTTTKTKVEEKQAVNA